MADEPPPDSQLTRVLAETRVQDLILGAMVGVVLAWQLTNRFAYVPSEAGWQIVPLRFAALALGALLVGGGLSYRLLRNWRRRRFYRGQS